MAEVDERFGRTEIDSMCRWEAGWLTGTATAGGMDRTTGTFVK